MKIIGIVLVVAGILALVYQGFTYTKTEKVLDIGSVHVTADTDKTVTLPPYVGVSLVVVGAGLVYFGRGKG